MRTIISQNKDQTWELAKDVLSQLHSTGINVLALKGELGAGKTTFAQGLLAAAGAVGPFTSPTFVIMKKYELNGINAAELSDANIIQTKFKNIYHFDCYRVSSADVLSLGWEEIINDFHALVLVEWPEKIEDILPKKYAAIDFKILGEEKRELTLSNL